MSRHENAGGTEPSLFGGQPAVQIWQASHFAQREDEAVRPARRRLLVASVFCGCAIIAVAGTALSSALPAARAAGAASPHPARAPRGLRGHAAHPSHSASEAPETDLAVRRFTGRVGPDLSASLTSAGVPELQGREYVALLSRAIHIDNELTVDDKFDLVLQRNSDGSLGQLVYAGMDRVARADIELMKWTDGTHVIWVNADGVGGDGSQSMRMPVQGHLTSGFGERFHPILGYERFHAGVDLGAAAGTPIVAAADGKVFSAGWAGGYGRAVTILHAGGLETKYGHMSRIVAFAGEQVHRGDVIGYVGSSGLSTGPHLHFEVMKNGRPLNPLSVKEIGGGPGQLEGAKLIAFQNQLRTLLLSGFARTAGARM